MPYAPTPPAKVLGYSELLRLISFSIMSTSQSSLPRNSFNWSPPSVSQASDATPASRHNSGYRPPYVVVPLASPVTVRPGTVLDASSAVPGSSDCSLARVDRQPRRFCSWTRSESILASNRYRRAFNSASHPTHPVAKNDSSSADKHVPAMRTSSPPKNLRERISEQ